MKLYIFGFFFRKLIALKKYIIFAFFLSLFVSSEAQTRALSQDIAFFAGGSYYIGDLNTSKQLYHINPAFGGMMRKNYNMRYSMGFHIYFGKVSASDADSKYMYQNMRNFNFSTKVIEFALQGEFNFLPYKIGDDKKKFSPFTFVGFSFYEAQTLRFSIPFGFGFKYSFAPRSAIEFEWGLRKLQNDMIDNTTGNNIPVKATQLTGFINKQTGYYNSNDWYSFIGFLLVYKISEESVRCKAYFD
jgi:hypothetical protein